MEKDKQIFSLIVKNAVYAFLKDKYSDYNIGDKEDKDNIEKLTDCLSEIEDFAHIPDKQYFVKQEYQNIKKYMVSSEFREEKLLELTKKKSQNLSTMEKVKILNSVIRVIHMDNKISKTEKPIILQVAKFLNINSNYEKIIKDYENSEFKKPMSTLLLVFAGLLFLSAIGGSLYWTITQKKGTLEIFKTNELVFNEVYFNKFLIYQNKYNVENDHFKKQAVYYLSGTVDIIVNPEKLIYNNMTKTVTYIHPKSSLFKIEMNLKQSLEVDKIDPKPITKEEAQKVAATIGLVGAYGGAKVASKGGNLLAMVLPPPYKLFASKIAGGVGGIIGGVGAYYVTFNTLENMKLSKDISIHEKSKIIDAGKKLIQGQMSAENELVKQYKENFEKFIKLQYGKIGKEVTSINYKVET